MTKNKIKKLFKPITGFTLIELLVVIAIIAILAVVVFVALDPLTRFRDSRDSARWQDVSALVDAVKISQVDNGGSYITAIAALTPGDVYMINDGSSTTGCDDQNTNCDAQVTADTDCVNLSELVNGGYIGKIPVSHNGTGTWTSAISGYTLTASSTGAIIVQACESENSADIKIIR